jgi:hypothetical protein
MNRPITSEEYLLLYALYQCPYEELPSFLLDLEDSDIPDVCVVAKWLGLVVPDETSVIKFKPTPLFLEQILCRSRKWNHPMRGGKAEVWEREALEMMVRDGFKEPHPSFDWLTEEVGRLLCFIGLMRSTDKGGWIPTDRLLNLAAESRRRDKKEGKIGVATTLRLVPKE